MDQMKKIALDQEMVELANRQDMPPQDIHRLVDRIEKGEVRLQEKIIESGLSQINGIWRISKGIFRQYIQLVE